MLPPRPTLLALALVLFAGLPLPLLTGARPAAAAPDPAGREAAATRDAYLSVQFSGRPESLRLRHAGCELASLPPEEAVTGFWECELNLPATPSLELELEAQWPEGGQAQAVTLTLEPDKLPPRQCTHWSEGGRLHRIFPFSW